MKERPILFNGEMVRAILADRKTQTRRPLTPQPQGYCIPTFVNPAGYVGLQRFLGDIDHPIVRCPSGAVGDRLWVREAFCPDWCDKIVYRADDPTGRAAREAGYSTEPKYRPSIHMPRWASRITLEITDVRVQRLKDFSWYDLQDEGFPPWNKAAHDSVDAFAMQWDDIYYKRGLGWDSNPWVWAITFRRLDGDR